MAGLIPPELMKLASKVLGYGVVAGATFVKIPQILKVHKAGSSKGLSRSMFESEMVGYTLVLLYGLHRKLALNAYGEYFFLLIQTLVLVGLVYRYDPPSPLSATLLWGAYLALVGSFAGGLLDDTMIDYLYAASNLIFWSARVPQIAQNFRNRSTGELSFLTCFLNTGGGAVRVLTTLQEGGGKAMLAGSVAGCLLNAILVLQILMYAKGGKIKPTPRRPKARKAE